METLCSVTFTDRATSYAMTYSEFILDIKIDVKKKVRGFCLNKKCKEIGELYKILNKNYRKNYSTDNKRLNFCPSCNFALFWTKDFIHIEGYKDKNFIFKERPVLCH